MTTDFKTVKDVEAYVAEQTNRPITATRTKTVLSLAYVEAGAIAVVKARIPAGVLYCLDRGDLAPAIWEIKRETED